MKVTPASLLPQAFKDMIKRTIIRLRYRVSLGRKVVVSLNCKFESDIVIGDDCSLSGTSVGRGTYISKNSKFGRAKIGRFCSIGQNVQTGFGLHPSTVFVSTHPAFFSLNKQAGFTFVSKQLFQEHKFVDKQNEYFVDIGNDVWIGNDVRIADGLTVGDGAIIGMGSIVTKDVEPYSINVGIPARRIGYRFNEKQIEFVTQLKWWNRDFEWLRSNAMLFSDVDALAREMDRG